jgi:hypothetical protein
VNWATVTVTDSTEKRYSLDVEAESTCDAAHLFLEKVKEHVIREPLPILSLETVFEVTVNRDGWHDVQGLHQEERHVFKEARDEHQRYERMNKTRYGLRSQQQ